jgi:lipooligosaccharide transport system ATP-binding protein
VITTHYMDEAEQLCDRLVVMDKGLIVAEGSPLELIRQHSTREVAELRFGVAEEGDNHDALAEKVADLGRVEALPDRLLVYSDDGDGVIARVHERGLTPAATLVRRSTLEDVFLRLTGRTLVD